MARRGNIRLFLGTSLLLAPCFQANAAEWTGSASVTPGLTYTDNVCLSEDNKQEEWIATITPAGTIAARGNRANFALTGSVKFNSLTDDDLEDAGCRNGSSINLSNREQFTPRLRGTADAVLVENWLYIDGTARIYQNEVTPFLSGGDDDFDRTGNTNTTYSYSVSPYIARRFKDVAELDVRYTFDDRYNTVDAVTDSHSHRVRASLGGVPNQARYGWRVLGQYSRVSYDDSFDGREFEDSELSSAQLNQYYQINRFWQVNGFVGQEWNDFVSVRDDIDGSYWDVGVRWTPNERTTVDLGVGERFFGSNPRASVTHRHKRSTFNAGYARNLTYNRDIRELEDSPPVDPGFPPPPGVDPGATSLSENPILDERFTLGWSWQGRRTGFGASAFHSEQTEAGGGTAASFRASRFKGIALSANRSLSQQTSVRAGVTWRETEPLESGSDVNNRFRESERWRVLVGVDRQLSASMNLGLRYTYTDRESENISNNYTENRVALLLRIDF